MKERLDVLLVNLGYAPSREKAKAVIMSGCVYVNAQKEDKAGTMFDTYAAIEVCQQRRIEAGKGNGRICHRT